MASLRKSFLQTLTSLAEKDDRIIFITGDVGFSFIEEFKSRFPNQYLNHGIMEQTMLGTAAGLAYQGWKPYVYTMKNFILLRAHEQLRNDIDHAAANVKLFGVGGSEAYRFLGMSHNLYEGEEQAILGTLKNTKTYQPLTEEDTNKMMLEEYENIGPAYTAI